MIEWIEIEILQKHEIRCRKCSTILSNTSGINMYAEIQRKHKIQFLIFIDDNLLNRAVIIPRKTILSNLPATFLMYLQTIHCAHCQAEIGTLFKTANIHNRFALGKIAFDIKNIIFSDVDQENCLLNFRDKLRQNKQYMVKNDLTYKNKFSQYTHKELYKNINEAYEILQQRGKQLLQKAIQISKQGIL